MIDDLGKVLDRVSSPADLAVVLLAGPLAYVLDAGVDVVPFLPPGYVAILVASLALGIRKGFEARLASRQDRRAAEERQRKLRERAMTLGERISGWGLPERLAETLQHELELYDAGITTADQFDAAFTACLNEYRSAVGARPARSAADD